MDEGFTDLSTVQQEWSLRNDQNWQWSLRNDHIWQWSLRNDQNWQWSLHAEYAIVDRMKVYRAPMPGAVERALDAGIVGLGGRLQKRPEDASEAVAQTDREYDERAARRLERFVAVPDGSYVWTRTADGGYHLGQIDGPYSYDASNVNIEHSRPCRWVPVEEHRVPPATLQTFARGGRNFQQTHDPNVGEQSEVLWGES